MSYLIEIPNMAKKTFKKISLLCYDEDFPELHREIVSIEIEAKKTKDYYTAVENIFNSIPLYSDDFPKEALEEIEEIYNEYMYSLEN